MTVMKTTGRAGRSTTRTARNVAKATALTVKWNIQHWRGLMPFQVAFGALAGAGLVMLSVWLWGPLVWAIAAGAALIAWVAIDGQIGRLDESIQRPSQGQLLYGYGSAALVIAAAHLGIPGVVVGGLMIVIGLALAFQWWFGDSAYSRPRKLKRAASAINAYLRVHASDKATVVTDVKTSSKGDTTYTVWCGDGDGPGKFKPSAEDLAHWLGIGSSMVIVRRLVADESRRLKITVLKSRPSSKRNIPHPALDPAERAEGGAWAPGTRSVLDGLPIGRVLGSMEDAIASARIYTSEPDAKCLGIFGDTGSGKTNTVSALLASAAACNDLVIRAADVVKGVLGHYHEQVLHGRTDDIDRLIADLEGLLALSRDRNEQLKDMRTPEGHLMLNWVPTPEAPGLLYVIEEFPATVARCDARQADRLLTLLETLPKEIRSAGISIILMAQSIAATTDVSSNLISQFGSNFLGHRVKKQHDGAVQGWSVDVTEKGLPGRGQCWVGNPDGGEPEKVLAFDVSTAITRRNEEWNAMLDAYVPHRPVLSQREADLTGWPRYAGGGAQVAQEEAAEAAPEVATLPAAEATTGDLETQVFGQVDLAEAPVDGGAPIDTGALAEAPVAQRIVRALREASSPLRIGDLEAAVGTSRSTVQRTLRRLAEEGLIAREGDSTATAYRLAA